MSNKLISIHNYYKVQSVWVCYSGIHSSLTPITHTFYREETLKRACDLPEVT